MKKVIIISLFVLGMIIPNISAKAIDVSNEDELRAAIEQGGDISLTNDIEVTQPLVIDKDVNIDGAYGSSIFMQGDNTLMTVNSGNVRLDVDLYAGWNGEYDSNYNPLIISNQGMGIVVNSGNVYLSNYIKAGKLGLEVNGGIVTGISTIYVGELNYDNETYSGGQGMVVNGGKVEFDDVYIQSGGTVLTVNNGANITLNDWLMFGYEGNGIEINDDSIVNLNGTKDSPFVIFAKQNAVYLNGGTVNLNGYIMIQTIDQLENNGYGIYVNKESNNKDALKLGNDFVFAYDGYGSNSNLSIYINPNINELRITDEKQFLEVDNNKLKLNFCSSTVYALGSQSEEEKRAICSSLESNLDGPIYSNELGKCTAVYINGVKQKDADASCNPVADNKNEPSQVVNVPATSAYASIIIITLGILCVIVSVIVTRRVTKKGS